MDMDNDEHVLLVEIHTRVNEVWKAMYGNGQVGLLTRVAILEEKHNNEDRQKSMAALRGGGLGALVALLVGLAAKLSGV